MSDTHSAVIVGREVAKAILATNAASALLKEYPECDGLRKELAEVSKRLAVVACGLFFDSVPDDLGEEVRDGD